MSGAPSSAGLAGSAAPGLSLDARQRAMLEEMGVKVWWPAARKTAPVADAAGTAEAGDAAVARRAGVGPAAGARSDGPSAPVPSPASRPPAPRPPSAARAATMPDPPAVVPAPRAPTTGSPASTRPSPSRGVPGVAFEPPQRLYLTLDEDGIAAPSQGGWLVVADMPPEADGRHGEPFAGEAGRLLDNMLRALRLHEGRAPVHLVRTRRGGAPGHADVPPSGEGADFPALADVLAPRIVLAMGPLAAQALLQSAEPLGRLRGRAAPLCLAPPGPLQSVPVVVTYPPAYLLRNPVDKARAWADLCLAADRLEAPPA